MTYAEKLRDPRWQKRRLEILERDKFTCQFCWDDQTELHIHHKYYKKGFEPWDYNEDCLITYCRVCHAIIEHCKNVIPENCEIKEIYKPCPEDNEEPIYIALIATKKGRNPVYLFYKDVDGKATVQFMLTSTHLQIMNMMRNRLPKLSIEEILWPDTEQ